MKKVIVILSTWTFFCIGLALFQSCATCGKDGPYNFRLVSIAGEAKRIDEIKLVGSPQSEYNVKPYLSSSKGTRYDSIGIDILNSVESVAFTTKGSFFNSAFACDPAIEFPRLKDINITSSEDYANIYPAGTDLKEIMSVREGYQVQGMPILTYLPYAGLRHGNLFFTFDVPPATSKVHNLTIKYTLLDGKEFEVFIQGLTISK